MSNGLRYGSNSQDTSKWLKDMLNQYAQMPRGVFNLSHRKVFDCPIFAVIPFDTFEMLPNSEMYLNYDIQMITKNPLVKRLLSGMHVEVATYAIDYNDCYEGWNNFITKGRSGKVSKSLPYVDFSLGTDTHTTCLPYSPAFLMSMAPSVFVADDDLTPGSEVYRRHTFEYNAFVQPTSILTSSGLTGISTLATLKASTAMRLNALPFVLYNKIAKKYQNSNLLQNNPHWYPENENHDNILPYSATGAVTTSDYDNPTKAFVPNTSIALPSAEYDSVGDDYPSYPWLNVLQLANRKGTYLNTGSPFPDLIRGDIPTLQVLNASINWDNVLAPDGITNFNARLLGQGYYNHDGTSSNHLALLGTKDSINSASSVNLTLFNSAGTSQKATTLRNSSSSGTFETYGQDKLKETLSKATVSGIEFSMAQWRYLATMTVMKERLALCDGSYNSMIKAMFGHNPNWHNHEPRFCGGSTQPIVFSEVVNTADNGVSPLGETAGRAVTSSRSSNIHVKADDFGTYISVLVVVPDEYECQGVKKMWSRLENAQQYFPILNNLSPDATQNKEAFVSGTNATDEDVFNYQERFAYYKSETNEVAGLMALPISKVGDDGAYIQNRILENTPQFNQEYIRGKLTDNEKAIFASTDQAEFCAVVGISKKFIAPIPEDSRPSDMGISF